MAQTRRLLNKGSVKNIMNKRTQAGDSLVGKTISATIEGNGALYDVKNKAGEFVESILGGGAIFQKRIFNLKVNSGLAMASARNQEMLKAGLAADKAGNADEADKHFQAYLRAVQLDFSVPTTSPIVSKLADGVEISAKLIKITTENGSLLSIDPATIRILEPVALESTTFSFDEEEVAAPVASEVESLKA